MLHGFKLFIIAMISGTILFTACNGTSEEGNNSQTDTTKITGASANTIDTSKESINVKQLFYSIPTPVALASFIEKTGTRYNKDLLNPIENVSEYHSEAAKALNLGVYGADLCNAGIFDQLQEMISIMKAISKLAKELGIAGCFNQDVTQRMEENKNNRDSLLKIVNSSFYNANTYLKSNDRASISALILSGAWVESLYLLSQATKSDNNTEVVTRIALLKPSLESLTSLLALYKGKEGVDAVLGQLQSLKELYNRVDLGNDKSATHTDPSTAVTTIENTQKIAIKKEVLEAIIKSGQQIRKNITKI
jgi:cytochrome c556